MQLKRWPELFFFVPFLWKSFNATNLSGWEEASNLLQRGCTIHSSTTAPSNEQVLFKDGVISFIFIICRWMLTVIEQRTSAFKMSDQPTEAPWRIFFWQFWLKTFIMKNVFIWKKFDHKREIGSTPTLKKNVKKIISTANKSFFCILKNNDDDATDVSPSNWLKAF